MNVLNPRGLLVALLLAAGAQAAPVDEVVDGYVREALARNLALQQRQLDVGQALAALDEARAAWRPQLGLSLRYSHAEGGREIEFPAGDLLNPVYRTLNEQLAAQGRPATFPQVDNVTIELLRGREQDSRLKFSQVLYAPAIGAGVAARSAGVEVQQAGHDAFARALVRDVRNAYYDWRRAQEAMRIVISSRELLTENLRVNTSLFDNGKVTRDQVLRAQAELLAVEQQQREAVNQIDLAASYLNFLRNVELDSEIRAVSIEQLPEPALPTLAEARAAAERDRPEQRQTAAALRAAQAATEVERAAFKPTVGFGIEAGTQGEDYGFGDGNRFAVASVVFEWQLFDGGARRARVSRAALAAQQAELQREEVADSIALEVQRARDNLATASDSLLTARARFEAAQAGFAIASRKRNAGSISQVEFLDARSALTSAELNLNLTRFDWLSRRAALAYATASEPLAELMTASAGATP